MFNVHSDLNIIIYQKKPIFTIYGKRIFVVLAFKLLEQISNAKFGLCFEVL